MWAFINADFIYNDYFKDVTFRNFLMSEFFNLTFRPPQLNAIML